MGPRCATTGIGRAKSLYAQLRVDVAVQRNHAPFELEFWSMIHVYWLHTHTLIVPSRLDDTSIFCGYSMHLRSVIASRWAVEAGTGPRGCFE